MSQGAESTKKKGRRFGIVLESLAAYVLFVGVPLLGLFWVVREGRSIEPPPHVGGTWQIAGAEDGAARCFGISGFGVEQSGQYLQLELGRRSARATLESGRIHGEVESAGGLCRTRPVTIAAVVEQSGLRGTLRAPGCETCTELAFRATRERPEE